MKNREKKRERERENEEMISQGNQCRTFLEQPDSRFLALPSSIIIIEILTRTPIADILNCRCVCKNLRDLISDPTFVNAFISRTPFLSILHRSRDINYHVFKLPGDNGNAASSHLVNTSFIPKLNSDALEVIGCSNGLLCLWNKYGITSEFYITNPVLREYVLHPNPKNDEYAALEEVYGFCSYPYPGKYKIIKIKTRRAYRFRKRRGYYRKTEAWILDVGTDGWRYAGDVPFPHWGRFSLVFFNGHYHWMASLDRNGVRVRTLYSLDIKEEKAHQFPAPSELRFTRPGQELVVLGEYLCIFDTSQSNRLDIWTMREYGVATSWTKDSILVTSIDNFRPFAVEENGMILMSDFFGKIFCYDSREGKFTEVYDCHGEWADVKLYTPTFLSLKHVLRGDFLTVRKVDSYN